MICKLVMFNSDKNPELSPPIRSEINSATEANNSNTAVYPNKTLQTKACFPIFAAQKNLNPCCQSINVFC